MIVVEERCGRGRAAENTRASVRQWVVGCLMGAVAVFAMAQPQTGVPAQPVAQDHVLDDFENLAAWKISATDDVKASLRSAEGPGGGGNRALCIDFDFGKVTGYISAGRTMPIDYPARYEFTMNVRGDAPANALQFKLLDASGENVWWGQRPEFRFPGQWQPLKFRQRQIEFAWGPSADRSLRRTQSVELVIASGSGAGKGSACFDRLTLRELPPQPPPIPSPSMLPGALSVDYGVLREFSALALRWKPGAEASTYGIALSDDGTHWRRVRRIERARGAVQVHWLPETEARFVRIEPAGGEGRTPMLDAIEPRDAASANAYFTQLAQDAPRGTYPRAYIGEQSYWTVLGVDGARTAALMSEDGVIEPVPGAGALEPFLLSHGRVLNWADARITHSLRDGDLPMPATHWQVGPLRREGERDGGRDGGPATTTAAATATAERREHAGKGPRDAELSLDIAAFGIGTPDAAQALARYTVRNLSNRAQDVTLALAWRPFQANPPTQFLAHPGGASGIDSIVWSGRTLTVNGAPRLQSISPPSRVRLEPLAAGPASAWLSDEAAIAADAGDAHDIASGQGSGHPARQVSPANTGRAATLTDPAGFASAALRYELHLRPGERREITVALPISGRPTAPAMAAIARAENEVAAQWRERLDRVRITGPADVGDVARTLRTALGHILVNRSGPALQPGARAYARSWIRDGALTSSALLRLGHEAEAEDFLRWFAPFQFGNGKVPCCATARGADPVPENDSDGEFAFAADELYRYTRDANTARLLWPHVNAAIGHMEVLRASERTARNLTPERRAYFGLMPPSISHEGYSDKPAYSYWDNFWAATGYRSAAQLATSLGLADDARRIGAQRDEFGADLLASITESTRLHTMNLLPGAADRGDVDPTSSTIALSPGGFYGGGPGAVPDALLRNTFDRYWRNFESRRADEAAGIRHGDGAYTPYEWRNVGAFVRLGERERALQAMAYFYRDRRPAGWNQWAEVVLRDAREPRFLGDMPHGWVASDQIRSVLDLFAYEHEGTQSLVLAAGVPMAWLAGPGLAIEGLRTPFGRLSWHAKAWRVAGKGAAREIIEFELKPLRDFPPGGVILRGPWPTASRVWIDGKPAAIGAEGIRLQRTPARVRIEGPSTI
ncbi:discoidin domain-containing protein [soil metagenome]